jgi:hypothetical protein
MLVRYGWPTAAVWGGKVEDESHDGWIKGRRVQPAPPYMIAEYSPGRLQFGAPALLFGDAFDATDDEWELTAPDTLRAAHRRIGGVWWPVEHSPFGGRRLERFGPGQLALFRRQSEVRLALAISARPAAAPRRPPRSDQLSDTTTLVFSAGPDASLIVMRTVGASSDRVVGQGTLPLVPVLVSLELASGDSSRPSYRSRRGLVPPDPLVQLPRGEIAVSQPVLFDLQSGALPGDADAVIPRMLGDLGLASNGKIGVFWETYGVAPGDSVRYTLAVVPTGAPGLLRRVGAALRIVDRPNEGVAVAWQDPGSAARADRVPGVPILPRSLALDLGSLGRGEYEVEVSVESPGRATVMARRAFFIR